VLALGLLAPWPALAFKTADSFVAINATGLIADTDTADFVNTGYPAVYCRLITANLGASQSVQLLFQGKWPDGTYTSFASTTAVATDTTSLYAIGSGLAANGGVTAVNSTFALPRVWRISINLNNTANADVRIDCIPMNTTAG
jgi:hypothetical protein